MVKTWHATWWLTKAELKRERMAYVFAFIFSSFFGLLTVSFYNSLIYLSLDIFYLVLLPVIGLAQSRAYYSFRFTLNDPFTQRLVFFKSLPIPANTVVLSRFTLMALSHAILVPVFFIVPYAFSETFRELLSPGQLVLFILTWIGYSLLAGGLYHYLEWSTSGKTLLWICFGAGFVLLVVSFTLSMFDTSVVAWTIRLAQDGFLYPLLAFFTGIAGAFLWKKAVTRLIKKRDLYVTK